MGDFLTLFLLAAGLSMDAFAVSICKGLSMDGIDMRKASVVGLWFGGFQGLMPVIGYYLGQSFHSHITSFDHWIAFILLVIIGANMIREAASKRRAYSHPEEESHIEKKEENPLAFWPMLVMAVATSIDALAVGLSMAMTDGEGAGIWTSAGVIAAVTFIMSAIGVRAGARLGHRYEARAELVGGIILIFIGVRVLVQHLAMIQ